MKLLKDRIITDGHVVSESALRVDSFLNHQLDAELMNEIGKEFAERFAKSGVTKIVTIEASGIAVAIMAGLYMKVPVVFAKKAKPSTMADSYTTEIFSFTKNKTSHVTIAKKFLSLDDNILVIDDFLARGHASEGLISIIEGQAKAKIAGVGIVIEKGFQDGGSRLRKNGYRVESLAVVKSLNNSTIVFE